MPESSVGSVIVRFGATDPENTLEWPGLRLLLLLPALLLVIWIASIHINRKRNLIIQRCGVDINGR